MHSELNPLRRTRKIAGCSEEGKPSDTEYKSAGDSRKTKRYATYAAGQLKAFHPVAQYRRKDGTNF